MSSSFMMSPLRPQVNNGGATDAKAQLTILAMAVAYNSLYLGACKRQMMSVTVPAHKSQYLKYKSFQKEGIM